MSIDIITLTASKNYTDKQIEKASIKGEDLSRYVQSVNGKTPDENGNVQIEVITDDELTKLMAALEEGGNEE